MAIQKQLVHLNLTGGLQKKDDQFLVIPSKLAVADNVEFDDASTVVRRGGQAAYNLPLPPFYITAIRSFPRNGVANIEFLDGATVRANGTGQPSDYANWRGLTPSEEPSTFARVGVQTRRLEALEGIESVGAGYTFDVAYGATAYCLVWTTFDASYANNIVQVSIRDINTDVELQRNVVLGALGSESVSQPRVIYDSTNNIFAIFTYHEDTAFVTASMKASRVSAVGGAFTGPTPVITMTSAAVFTPMTDVAIFAGQGYALCARNASSGNIQMRLLDLNLTPLVAATSSAVATAAVSLTAHATFSAGVLTGHALYGAGANLRGRFLPSNTGVASAENTITTVAARLVGRIAVITVGAAMHMTFDTFVSTADTYATTYLANVSAAQVLSNRTSILTNCFVAGRPLTMRSRNYVPVVFTSVWFQSVLLLLDITSAAGNLGGPTATEPLFAARLDYGEAAYTAMASTTTARVQGSSEQLLAYFKYEANLRLAGTSNLTPVCVSAAKFFPAEQLGHQEINGLTFLAGAMPMICDGSQIVEEGFHWGPEVATAALTPVATGTGIITFPDTTGTYIVAFTEGWQDAQGSWHESAVSAEYTVTITAGSGLLDINPTIIRPPSLKLSSLVLYRSLRSSTNTSLYLCERTTTDTDLVKGEQLYTAGGVLSNTPAPSCRHVSLFQKRLVLSGCGDGSRLHWSKQVDSGFGVEFTSGDPTHQTQVPVENGRVVASEEMDDRLVVLCESGVGIIDGQGPNASGTQGQYSDFRSIINETGASWGSPKSIIRGPEGIWFRSPFGMRLVSRSGALDTTPDGKQAGAEVDSLVSGDVVAVCGSLQPTRFWPAVRSKQQIRFYQSSGTCLVWDYRWKQWTRFTGMENIDAVFADGRYYHLSNVVALGSLLRYTDDAVYFDVADNGSISAEFEGYIETAPLSFAGIQGFQRVTRLMLLGQTVGASSGVQVVRFYAGFDFDQTSRPTGETASVGTSPVGGTIQLQHHFARQKCESLKIGIAFGVQAGNSGRFRLTDLTLQVGVKAGYNKLPSSRRF